MNKIILVATLVISVILGGCNSCNTEKPKTNEATKITVAQWGQEKYLIYLPFYIAQEKGFFKDEGLDITVKFSGNDDQVFATVLKGEAQFGIGDPVFTAISREKGAKGKVIGSIVDGVTIWGVTNKDNIKTIEQPSDLAGLKVGTFPDPSTNYALMKKTIMKGGDLLKNTTIVQAPIGSQLALLENGSADIAMDLEPGTSIAESKGYRVVYSSPKFYGRFAFTGLTTTEEYINANKETVQKFVNAIEKALQYCHTDEAGTAEIAAKLFPNLDKTVVANAVKRMVNDKTIPDHAVMSDEAWQKAMQVRVDIGDMKEMKPTSDAVDNSFAENAAKQK
ncbi:MAG: ABC transporter substrate-binding protein [Saprospiraceae bacterium]|nr:ABC transporter substrate-binding protein [Saprospiraceae bacterium]MBK7797144.1 ABC transporter substrate-binding protein [Saprospiraceae bacterium]